MLALVEPMNAVQLLRRLVSQARALRTQSLRLFTMGMKRRSYIVVSVGKHISHATQRPTSSRKMLAADDVRALRDPKPRDNAIVVARAAVESLVAFRRRVDFSDGRLADAAAEDDFWQSQAFRR